MHARHLIAPIVGLFALTQIPSPKLGSSLVPGMQLLYESNGVTTPWTIDSVSTGLEVGGLASCSRIVLRIGDAARPQTRTHCVSADTMMTWDDRNERHLPARRLTVGSLEISAGNRGTARFEVAAPDTAMIENERFVVLPTVVTTFDSAGTAIRRLTERFAPALATATEGVFEVPDSAHAGQWRVTQRFRLTSIRKP